MILQRTLRKSTALSGIGLHSGKEVRLEIHPAAPNTGIIFIRTDIKNHPEIEAHFGNVVSTQLATTLGKERVTLSTVEHLLAALQGLGVDNARIDVNGPELPVLDGSSLPFVNAINEVGVESQLQARPTLVLRKKVELKLKEKWAVVEPSSRLEIHGSIEWDHPAIGYQEFHYTDGITPFSEIAGARTFCLLKDVEAMRKMGLALGGSLDNAVVVDETKVLNPNGLRYENEFVRHKVLDALGDFKLAGLGIQAYFRLHRAGHDLHSQLLGEIFKDADNYEILDLPQTRDDRAASAAAQERNARALRPSWAV